MMNLSAIILALEAIAWRHEHNMQPSDETAKQLDEQAEFLFRLSARIRKDGK